MSAAQPASLTVDRRVSTSVEVRARKTPRYADTNYQGLATTHRQDGEEERS
jgi:hypothetical protein